MSKVFIIAEAGVNHNGDMALAEQLIDVAAEAGADAVKFQTFNSKKLVVADAPKAGYQKDQTGDAEGQLEMLQKLELSQDDHVQLRERCENNDIMFLSSAFDLDSIEFLIDFGVKIFKIPSGEITNLPYLRKVGASKLPIILSTGMADMSEIEAAIQILVESGSKPGQITILHCNTQYPTPFADVNLRAMLAIAETTGFPVGYSDHTVGIEVSIAAVAMGAVVIEKHFTLDKAMDGPDHAASLSPEELMDLVQSIRNIEAALGSSRKGPTSSEQENLQVARKSIVAARAISKGEVFSELNLTVKRPGDGRSPMDWDKLIGSRADRDYEDDEAI